MMFCSPGRNVTVIAEEKKKQITSQKPRANGNPLRPSTAMMDVRENDGYLVFSDVTHAKRGNLKDDTASIERMVK